MTLDDAFLAAVERGNTTEADRLALRMDTEQAAAEAQLTEPDALRGAALRYAAGGAAVFPCTPGGKTPGTRHGFKDATTDPDRVTAWWTATPDANIGLPTGVLFDVFDLDGPDGLLAVHQHIDTGGFPTILARAFTPRGRHYYVPATGRGNRAGVLPRVDYRGTGGYVIAPPSRTPTGRYRWLDGEHLHLRAPA